MNINLFVKSVLSQNKTALRSFFCKEAVIRWHCTNELFSVEEYMIIEMDEYWSDDGSIPEWRKSMNIGKPIL